MKFTDQKNDIVTRKYSPRGAVRWTKFYNNDEVDDYENGNGVAVGDDGSVYVVGDTRINLPYKDIWVRKYK